MSVVEITKPSEFKRDGGKCVLMFVASFHEACQRGGPMDQVLGVLAAKHSEIQFYRVDAELVPDLAEEFVVEVVPTFCLVAANKVMDRVEGALPSELATKLELFKTSVVGGAATGSPENPKCKFSKKLMELFKNAQVSHFASFDVLSDESIRSGLKEYSNWPTFPQLFVGGKLVGGVDIIEEMGSTDLFDICQPAVAAAPAPATAPAPVLETLHNKLVRLTNQAPVMLFMKGQPEAPQCGFSAQICKLLKQDGVQFGSFDILTDDSVRQGLKSFSDWPTFPQLYHHGKLVGGLDVVKELAEEEGGLSTVLQ
ncbi:Grx4 family monothiol glutaredoxin [Batrachochytrium salamandrivorans]|nr:Grx4 family monothiol glutaredoxin [Batrachochytrium salamandrivorans]